MLLKRVYVGAAFVFVCLFSMQASTVEAQFAEDASEVQIITDPLYPAPKSEVVLSLDAYSINTTGATIAWFIDGTERTVDRNSRSIRLTTGALTDTQTVLVKITLVNGHTLTVSRTITPSEVDVVLEADTYVPAFYKGRALPSSNAVIRAVAIPHSEKDSSPSALTYEWKQGQTVLFGGPVKGKYAALITLSPYDDEFLSVRVTNASGELVGGKTILLRASTPELYFYEENPLRGLHNKAIRGSLTLLGNETTIHAEPYFMATDLSKRSATFTWDIGGIESSGNAEDNHTITLRRTVAGGSAQVGVHVLTADAIPQYAQKLFNIVF